LLAFVLSAFIAGIAGALYAHLVGFVHPGTFPLWLSIMLLAAVILGGTNRVASGAIAGSAIIFGLPEFLRGAQELQMVGFGIAIILVILFAPTGFMGIVDSLRAKVIGLLRRRALSTEEL
jgi:branched-chain amino acid transport system permease protein